MNKNKFIKNYFKILDKKAYILSSILVFGILLIIYSICTAYEPLNTKKSFFDLSYWYSTSGHLWSDLVFDMYVPFISCIILCGAFFREYTNNINEIITFYNRGKFNLLVFFKWFLYTITLMLISIISSMASYRNVLTDFNSFLILMLRFIPPILYMNGLVLIILVFCKNVYISMSLVSMYITMDLLYYGRYPRIFTLYCNSFYLKTPQYFYFNRILLFTLSIIFVLIACKRASKL